MYCGKIEHSGSSKCSFCESTLYYQELDTDMLDSMVLTDLKRKVLGANVSLEKENEVVGHCAYLSKEARDLYEGINRHIDKEKNHYGSDKNSLKVHINQNAIIEDDFR
jgi:hypothetical protein